MEYSLVIHSKQPHLIVNKLVIVLQDALGQLHNMVPNITQVSHRITNASWGSRPQVWETHSFLLVYDGEAIIGCNEERQVSRGDFVYFKPGDVRWGSTNERNPMKCFGMDFTYACLLYDKDKDDWHKEDIPLPLNSYQQIHDSHVFSRMISLFQALAGEWISPVTFNRSIRLRSSFMELLNLLILWNASKPSLNYDKIRKVEKVSQYMLENYSRRMKLQELADVVQVSESYLQVIFKEITGSTPIEYLIRLRMNKAKELIKEGDYSIREISEFVGFSDAFYFSKCFKKQEGMSPSAYQKIAASQRTFV